MHLFVPAAALVLWSAWAWWEWSRHQQRLQRIPITVHVNGTRGKSTVTRLIAAGLREAGLRTVAKTTGSAPIFLYPDGGEDEIKRRGEPDVREQLAVVKRAAALGADALVLECMVIRPELQWAAARIFPAPITVITNVRPDHVEIFSTLEEYAHALALTIPVEGWLVTASGPFVPFFETEAKRRGTRVKVAVPDTVNEEILPESLRRYPRENVALGVAVLSLLGIPNSVGLAGMAQAAPDPGAFAVLEAEAGQVQAVLVNAFAANDPYSTVELLEECLPAGLDRRAVVLYNHRRDRPARARSFRHFLQRLQVGGYQVFSVGETPAPFRGIRHLGCPEPHVLIQTLAAGVGRVELVGIGNLGGYARRLLDFFLVGGR